MAAIPQPVASIFTTLLYTKTLFFFYILFFSFFLPKAHQYTLVYF